MATIEWVMGMRGSCVSEGGVLVDGGRMQN